MADLLRRVKEAFLGRLRGLSWLARIWWGGGLLLIVGTAATDTDSCVGVLFAVLLVLWLTPTVVWGLYQLWLKITYRIGVRLFFSYVLIGVLPFLLLPALGGIAGYVLIGQYASAALGDVSDRLGDELARMARETVAVGRREGPRAAVRRLENGPDLPADLARLVPHVDWVYAANGEAWHSSGADLEPPSWIDGGVESGTFHTSGGPVLAGIARQDGHVAAALVRLGEEAAGTFSAGQWYQVVFLEDEATVSDDNIQIHGLPDAGPADEGEEVAGGAAATGGADAGEAPAAAGFWRRLLRHRWVWGIRVSPELRSWADGSVLPETAQATFVKTSPQEAAAELFRSPYEYGENLWRVFLIMSAFFLLGYLGVVSLAGYSIWAITRSTARLTRGTRQVRSGDLDYRIPVKRHDQLGDLAAAFNQMTESVAGMLDEVAEKERLKKELELAREIQQSLLPASHLEHGTISVNAYFRPAAEVGGDYFDLFPLERGRLIVAVGDVAGHGLPTGLLMAMVKSAVATLVYEGHRGRELLERVNHFMLQQPREHRMVTLAIADVDVEAGVAEVTNAAHPPVYLSGGTVREVMLPALPVGYKWPKPPPTERLELGPDSRLVFYSDGLVEAVDASEEQFGYERLREALLEHAELTSEELLVQLLKELEEHTGGRPLDDDLTVLIIDCAVPR